MLVPQNNQFSFIQTFKKLFLQALPNNNVILAPPTGSYVYVKGSILAQYTSGVNAGQYVNYVSAGSSGQGVAKAILIDDGLTYPQSQSGAGTPVLAMFGGSPGQNLLQDSQLDTLVSGDKVIGMAALGAKTIPNWELGTETVWYMP